MAQTSFETQPDGSFPLDHFVDKVVKTRTLRGAHLSDIITEAEISTAMETPGFSRKRRKIMLTREGGQHLEESLEGLSGPGAVREDETEILFNRRSPDLPWDESQQIEPSSLGDRKQGRGFMPNLIEVESLPWEGESTETFPASRVATSPPHQELDSEYQEEPLLEETLVKSRKANSVRVLVGQNQRAPAVAVSPFRKKEEIGMASKERTDHQGKYPFPPWYLGSVLHYGVQRKLAEVKGPIPMLDYLLHLDRSGRRYLIDNDLDSPIAEQLSEVGLARTVLEKTDQVSEQVVDAIGQHLPEGYDPVAWLSEVPFVATTRQTEIIARSLEDKDLQDFATAVFGADLYQLGERVISSPDPRLFIRDGRSRKEVTLSDIYQMAQESEKTEEPSYLDQLSEYLGAISGYYMLNNAGFLGEANIPEPLEKLILCAAARCDLIGLMSREGKRQPQTEDLIAEFVERSRGRLFGRRPLHDFVHTPSEAIGVQKRLVEAIIKGDVAVWLGEIKSHLTKQDESDFYRDLAHTVFAAMQSLTRSLNHPISFSDRLSDMVSLGSRSQKRRIRPDLLIELMSASSGEKEAVLLGLRPFMGIVDPPNSLLGIEINWPVVDSNSTQPPLFGLRPDQVAATDPTFSLSFLDPRVLRRFVAEKGNDFLDRLMEV